MSKKRPSRNQIISVMRKHVESARDNRTNEVNHTLLAELTAESMDVYDHDYEIPEEFFELAIEFN